jgi:hypothetical protein
MRSHGVRRTEGNVDILDVSAAQWALAKSDVGLADVVIVPAAALKVRPLPARPFIAWQPGVVSGESGDMRGVFGTWYAYDDMAQGYARLNLLINRIATLYVPSSIEHCRTTTSNISANNEDTTLGLNVRSIQVTSKRLS